MVKVHTNKHIIVSNLNKMHHHITAQQYTQTYQTAYNTSHDTLDSILTDDVNACSTLMITEGY